jgi:hypothetical protein
MESILAVLLGQMLGIVRDWLRDRRLEHALRPIEVLLQTLVATQRHAQTDLSPTGLGRPAQPQNARPEPSPGWLGRPESNPHHPAG